MKFIMCNNSIAVTQENALTFQTRAIREKCQDIWNFFSNGSNVCTEREKIKQMRQIITKPLVNLDKDMVGHCTIFFFSFSIGLYFPRRIKFFLFLKLRFSTSLFKKFKCESDHHLLTRTLNDIPCFIILCHSHLVIALVQGHQITLP